MSFYKQNFKTVIVCSCNWINRLLLQEQWELVIIKEVAERGGVTVEKAALCTTSEQVIKTL